MAAPAEVPPPMVAGAGPISVFLIYAPSLFRDVSGNLYIGVFRSRPSSGALDGWVAMLEEENHVARAPKGVGPATHGIFALLAPFA